MKGSRIYSSDRDKKLIITLFCFFTVSMQALSARSIEQDAGIEENLEEKMKQYINDIKKLVQKKKLGKKNKNKVLKLLGELSEKAKSCSTGSNDAGNEIKEDIEVIEILVNVKKFAKKKEVKAKVLNLLEEFPGKAECCGGRLRVNLFRPIDISNRR